MLEHKLSAPVYLVDGLRTPIGVPFRSFKELTAQDLAVHSIKALVKRNKLNVKDINEVILGNVVSSGLGQNISRQVAVLAGVSENVSAFTVNNVCGAGMLSVILSVQSILSEATHLNIAGGVESATQAPFLVDRKKANKDTDIELVDSLLKDGLYCQLTEENMGSLIETMTFKKKISREDQDEYAFQSHTKACLAQSKKYFSNEIVPIRIDKKIIDKDDHPKKNIQRDLIARQPAAFRSGGSVTAGNSSIPCDGAAVVLVASERKVKNLKVKPAAKIVGYVSIAAKPSDTFSLAVLAIEKCLKTCGLKKENIDLFEISEAFAAQIILTIQQLDISKDKVNVFGGDIAFGHPLGAAGARILVTLMNALKIKKKKIGLACVSFGGGGAMAMVIERI